MAEVLCVFRKLRLLQEQGSLPNGTLIGADSTSKQVIIQLRALCTLLLVAPVVDFAGPASVGERHRSRVGRTPADGRPGSRRLCLIRHVSGELAAKHVFFVALLLAVVLMGYVCSVSRSYGSSEGATTVGYSDTGKTKGGESPYIT